VALQTLHFDRTLKTCKDASALTSVTSGSPRSLRGRRWRWTAPCGYSATHAELDTCGACPPPLFLCIWQPLLG